MKTRRGQGNEKKERTPRQGRPPPASQKLEGRDFEDVRQENSDKKIFKKI